MTANFEKYLSHVGVRFYRSGGVELVLAFLAGVVMGGALDRFLLPVLVDAWIDRLRRHER